MDGTAVCETLIAEYTLTKDGLVYGVITGVDVDVKRDPRCTDSSADIDPDNALMTMATQALIDCPFSFRTRMTSVGLMVSNVKIAPEGLEFGVNTKELYPLLGGMYKLSKDNCAPLTKPRKVISVPQESGSPPPATKSTCPYGAPVSPTNYIPGALSASGAIYPSEFPSYPAPGYGIPPTATEPPMPPQPIPPLPPPMECQQKYEYVPTSAPQALNPAQPMGSCAVRPRLQLAPTQPPNVPTPAFEAMVDAVGQLLDPQPTPSVVIVPAQTAPICPVQQGCRMTVTGMVLTPCSTPLPTTTGSGPLGTWVREVGPLVYSIQIAPEHLTMTITSAKEIQDDKVVTEGIILTADYHIMRDGTTAIGLITSLDFRLDGDLPNDAIFDAIAGELSQLQKAVTDKPLALSLRVYGDALVIGNVRLPEMVSSEAWLPITALGGRYTAAGDKPLPKPRVTKVSVPQSGFPPLPSPAYNPGYPTGIIGAPIEIHTGPPTGFPQGAIYPPVAPQCIPVGMPPGMQGIGNYTYTAVPGGYMLTPVQTPSSCGGIMIPPPPSPVNTFGPPLTPGESSELIPLPAIPVPATSAPCTSTVKPEPQPLPEASQKPSAPQTPVRIERSK
jgi:hypothetical protein